MVLREPNKSAKAHQKALNKVGMILIAKCGQVEFLVT